MASDSDLETDPLILLSTDRSRAADQKDGCAALCTLGTVNACGDAEQRTLVLRELNGRLALFFSAHAPKWQELQQRPTCSLQLYMPSIQVQYRVRAAWTEIDAQLVHDSWSMRPDIPKKLDWLYEQHAQSSAIDRNALLAELDAQKPVPDVAPASAMGVFLEPLSIERLELSPGVHHRTRWEAAADSGWIRSDLVP